jgi:hypothetical protein
MKITVYNFFKYGDQYIYEKNKEIYKISANVFECFKRQYIKMGWYMFESDLAVSFSYVHETTEEYMKRIRG